MTVKTPSLEAITKQVATVGDDRRRAVASGLLDGSIPVTAEAYEVQAVVAMPARAAEAIGRVFQMTLALAGSSEVARGLLVGLLQPTPGRRERSTLVWTSPGLPAQGARSTVAVIRERIQAAERSVIVVGYSVTSAADPLLRDLAAAARRRVAVTIVADRLEDKLEVVLNGWPADLAPPLLWTRPADPSDPMSALHAKVLVFDDRWLLVTSANLTFHGLLGNLELGVLLEGSVAGEMTALLRRWIAAGLVVPLS